MELKHFLVTGQLQPVCCGMTEQEVLSKLGNPSHRIVFEKAHGFFREVRLFYGALTIFFEKEMISQYGLWWEDDELGVPSILNPVGYFPSRKSPMEEFVDFMRKQSINFRERMEDEDDSCKYFTEGDVAVRGYRNVQALVVACPGTERWRTMKERWRYQIAPLQPFSKPSRE